MDKTQPSEQPSLEDARTLLLQGAPVDDVVARSGLSRAKVLGMKGAIAKAAKRLKAANKPTKEETKPQSEIQAENKPQLEATMRNDGHDIEESSPRQSFPSDLLDTLGYYQKMPAKDAIIQLVKENSMLKGQVNRNNGHGTAPFYYPNSEGELEHEMAENIKWKRYKGMMGEDTLTKDDVERIIEKAVIKSQKEGSSDLKGVDYVLKLIEILKGMSPGPQKSQAEEALTTLALSLVKENTQARGASNQIDLKIQEMLQNERLENKKIDFEILKHEEGKEGEKQLYTLIGQLVGADGLIGKGVSALGSFTKNRIERGGQPSVPKVIEFACPTCQKPVKTLEGTKTVLCQNCNALLALQTQQPTPQPSQEPQQESPQPQPIEQSKPEEIQKAPESENEPKEEYPF